VNLNLGVKYFFPLNLLSNTTVHLTACKIYSKFLEKKNSLLWNDQHLHVTWFLQKEVLSVDEAMRYIMHDRLLL